MMEVRLDDLDFYTNSWASDRVPEMATGHIPDNAMWKLDDALALIRSIQTRSWEIGYHLNLGGGVLNRGYSDSDLDILAMYMSIKEVRPEQELLAEFVKQGFTRVEKHDKFKDVVFYRMRNDQEQCIEVIFVRR